VKTKFSPSAAFPSTAGHVEPGLNLGGPPPKAKYYLVTDSETVARAKDEKHPFKGSQKYLKPCTYTAVGARCPVFGSEKRVTAWLLQNHPASYRVQLG
jgi:hypothetical protein